MTAGSRTRPPESHTDTPVLQWFGACLFGVTLAHLCFAALPTWLLRPDADENVWMAQAWRISWINLVSYAPMSLAQWWVLRHRITQAWWWVVIPISAVVLLYPGSIGLSYALGAWELAWGIWFFGFGGMTIYPLAQWVCLYRWTHSRLHWWLSCLGSTLGWLVFAPLGATATPVFLVPSSVLQGVLAQLPSILTSALYQLMLGGILFWLTQRRDHGKGTAR